MAGQSTGGWKRVARLPIHQSEWLVSQGAYRGTERHTEVIEDQCRESTTNYNTPIHNLILLLLTH